MMLPIKTALLYVGPLNLDLQSASKSLITHLNTADDRAEEICPVPGDALGFRIGDLKIGVSLSQSPLSADCFTGALESPLCRQLSGALTDSLSRHTHHMLITLDRTDPSDQTDLVQDLEIAHSVTTFVTKLAPPAAIHWRQSNLLLTGAQYLGLADDPRPWVLFANLRETITSSQGARCNLRGITIENAADFIGSPIELCPTDISLNAACAAALSLLRHAAQSSAPLSEGQIVKSGENKRFRLHHVQPNSQSPNGIYQLSVAIDAAETTPGDAARLPGVDLAQANPSGGDSEPPMARPADDPSFERQQSLILSYIMLVVMPPLGAVLMVLNLIFGANAWRTGFVAAASVAVLLTISAYAFLNAGAADMAILTNPEPVQTGPLHE